MMDQNCKAYLMEINSNPSMNMFLERQNEKGENEKEISELDKYLKTLVIEDALKIIRSKKQLDDLGWYIQILPTDDEQYNQYYIYDQIREIFTTLTGVKKTEFITASQFQKLGRFPELTRSHFSKAHYDIVFKEVTRNNESNYMNWEEFFNAMELVVSKLYAVPLTYDNLKEFVTIVEKSLGITFP